MTTKANRDLRRLLEREEQETSKAEDFIASAVILLVMIAAIYMIGVVVLVLNA